MDVGYNARLCMSVEQWRVNMPIYSYQCDKCGTRFDRLQKFTDKPLTRCPECRGPVRRLIQPAGIVFKGSGWYITDSKKSSSATVPSGKDKSKESTESKSAETDKSSSAD
jgi:putative FmdB family regulatory protein